MISEKINILIVDDHPMVLEGMQAILKNFSHFSLVGKAASALEAIKILNEKSVDIVITDINLPEINGIDLCKRIKKEFSAVKVIAMSTFIDKSFISQMIESGASGYLSKNASPEEIGFMIDAAIKNQLFLKVEIDNVSASPNGSENSQPLLTRREKEVLQLISQGFTNKTIADQLFISQNTVDTHRKNLLAKFKVLNTASLIAAAGKNGYI